MKRRQCFFPCLFWSRTGLPPAKVSCILKAKQPCSGHRSRRANRRPAVCVRGDRPSGHAVPRRFRLKQKGRIETWAKVNRAAAALCAWFAGAGFVLAALFLLLRAGKEITLPLFFLYAAVSVFSVLFFPPRRAKT